MKRLGISQRVEHVQSYGERRDCLDQRWASFALQLGYVPVPLANVPPDQVQMLLDNLELDGVLLSGGNSLAHLDPSAGDAAPERDAFEATLLRDALDREIHVVGICRGMQLINIEFGGELCSISDHVASRHSLSQEGDVKIPSTVNSYHKWAIPGSGLPQEFTPLALDQAGNVEAFDGKEKHLLGLMWHPEREQPFRPLDIELIKRYLP
jgi:gamma-glutamyl-gamma-aminobutyrate hydrolase PuuD